MPASYAHYRLGQALLSALPADARKAVRRFPRLYDMGLHGPDIFFHCNPVLPTKGGYLGIRFHEQTGKQFFTHARTADGTEAGLAYLCGVLSHYCLDASCHPFVRETALQGKILHSELETEFDRYLLELDGKVPTCGQDLTSHMHLTEGECETVCRFYPQSTPRIIKKSVRNMALFTRQLMAPVGIKRTVIRSGLSILGKNIRSMMMTPEANPNCAYLNGIMQNLYDEAAARFPAMLTELLSDAPLGKDFSKIFG